MKKIKPTPYAYDPAWTPEERHAFRCKLYRRNNREALRKRRSQRERKFITRLCVLGRAKVMEIMSQNATPVRQILRRVQAELEADGVKKTSVRFMKILELRLKAEELAIERRKLALREKGIIDAAQK